MLLRRLDGQLHVATDGRGVDEGGDVARTAVEAAEHARIRRGKVATEHEDGGEGAAGGEGRVRRAQLRERGRAGGIVQGERRRAAREGWGRIGGGGVEGVGGGGEGGLEGGLSRRRV